jgi:Type II secretion system (T2SS), protein K
LKQKWAGGPGNTNDVLSAIDLKNYPLLRADGTIGANLSIDIKDLDRKFNINTVGEDLLMEALTLIGVDAAESRQIANSILDWRDVDKDPRMGGAEDEYYQRQAEEGYPPYSAKNGPIDDLSELLLVKGISPAMYFGSSGGEATPIIQRRNSARVSKFEEPSYAVGFVDLFTPLSSRMVNINTASETVLQMIPGIEYDMAQAIIRGGPMSRAGIDGIDGTEDDVPYASVGELAQRVPQIPPQAVQLLAQYLTTRSLIFEAKISIDIGGTKRECVAIIRRNGPKDVQTLNMYWKS